MHCTLEIHLQDEEDDLATIEVAEEVRRNGEGSSVLNCGSLHTWKQKN